MATRGRSRAEESPTSRAGAARADSQETEAARAYQPALWERLVAAVCAVATFIVVFIVVLRREPFSDPNQVLLLRIVLSTAIAIIGGVVPGFLHVSLHGKGLAIRAGGALALFVVTYFFSPSALPSLASVEARLSGIQRTGEDARTGVERLSTQFDRVFVQAIFELPSAHSAVAALRDAITEAVAKVESTRASFPTGMGFAYSTKDGAGQSELTVSFAADRIQDQAFLDLSPKFAETGPVVEFLRSPRLQVGVNRRQRPTEPLAASLMGLGEPPDLYLFAHGRAVDPGAGNFGHVYFDRTRGRLLAGWNGFEYAKSKWATNRKVMSIHDLDGAQLVVMLSNPGSVDPVIDSIARDAVPVWLNIHFDTSVVSFSEFRGSSDSGNWRAYISIFPSAEAILGRKTYLPPQYSIGGY